MLVLEVASSFPQVVRPRSHASRGNAVKGALRRESRTIYKNAHRAETGRSASGTAFPRGAWEREVAAQIAGNDRPDCRRAVLFRPTSIVTTESAGTITQELK
jgi:hypothetical protein